MNLSMGAISAGGRGVGVRISMSVSLSIDDAPAVRCRGASILVLIGGGEDHSMSITAAATTVVHNPPLWPRADCAMLRLMNCLLLPAT